MVPAGRWGSSEDGQCSQYCPRLLSCVFPVMVGTLHVSPVPPHPSLPTYKKRSYWHQRNTKWQPTVNCSSQNCFLACDGRCLLRQEEACGYAEVFTEICIKPNMYITKSWSYRTGILPVPILLFCPVTLGKRIIKITKSAWKRGSKQVPDVKSET